ncbi:vomeronasal type-2 receptor 26-like [Engystomops pustulosus]|uniref:vomeronasal type-2 receptor 26-like n=1 Tax=Engystomops pustulosus TaxID=76066 RepID=UPI003AFB28B3
MVCLSSDVLLCLPGVEVDCPPEAWDGGCCTLCMFLAFGLSGTFALLTDDPTFSLLRYGVSDPILHDRDVSSTKFQFAPDDSTRYAAIVTFLKGFGWNWVGIITTGEGSNEMGVRELSNLMAKHGICIEYIINLSRKEKAIRQMEEIDKYTAQVVVICGPYSPNYIPIIRKSKALIENITLILHESWIGLLRTKYDMIQFINCSLVLMVKRRTISRVVKSIQNVNPSTRPNDPLLMEIWYKLFHCLTKDKHRNIFYRLHYGHRGVNCTEIYSIPPAYYDLIDKSLYYTYVSVYILAHALHIMKATGNKLSGYKFQWKLWQYMKYVMYKDPSGYHIRFDPSGEVLFHWQLATWIMYPMGIKKFEFVEKIITVFIESPKERFSISQSTPANIWKNDRMPWSRCNDPCSPGSRKASIGGNHICCYNCDPCSEGEISPKPDSDTCHPCPEDEWPDEMKVRCIPKTYEFLSYETDNLVFIFLALTLTFSVITLLILISYIYYWDTPIVKANNRTVSFILLASILLSFLCVFFFLGRPVDITCLLRQVSFGIFFTIGVSSVLAKTITVCIAFKATKPGSSWKKFVSFKVSNSVVLVCSSVQVLICVIWLLVSPPYVEYNHHTYPGKIIIQCNEGSDICFYSMLGYMGLLASVSFVLAFMVRTLPDSFNEAKYITFSMLLFCSVWIAMIPAYLSTRGKYMVAVEVFAILTSCAGVLGCIFFPKLYILLLKPEQNSRNVILEKTKL